MSIERVTFRRFAKLSVQLLGLLAVAFGCFLLVDIWNMRGIAAGPGDASLASHLTTRPKPLHIQVVTRNGLDFVAIVENQSKGLIPSGWPVFIFDKTGALADWTGDSGDDTRFQQAWTRWWDESKPALTVDEANAWVAGKQGS